METILEEASEELNPDSLLFSCRGKLEKSTRENNNVLI